MVLQYTISTLPLIHKLVSFTQPPCLFTFSVSYMRITSTSTRLLIDSCKYFPCRILAFYLCIAYILQHNTSILAYDLRTSASCHSPSSHDHNQYGIQCPGCMLTATATATAYVHALIRIMRLRVHFPHGIIHSPGSYSIRDHSQSSTAYCSAVRTASSPATRIALYIHTTEPPARQHGIISRSGSYPAPAP